MGADNNVVMGMDNKLYIRLAGVDLPEGDSRAAIVTFDLLADGYTVGSPHKTLTSLVQEVGLFKTDSGALDFDGMVSEAAGRLQVAFARIADQAAKIQDAHASGEGPR